MPDARSSVRSLPLAGAFVLGVVVATAAPVLAAGGVEGPELLVGRVFQSIRNLYFEEVDPRKLAWAAARGMVGALDPYSAFYDPAQAKQLEEPGDARYYGLGLELTKREGAVAVLAAIDGTPASRGDVQAGDVVLAIDGNDARHLTVPEVGQRLKGAMGTTVALRLGRPGNPVPRDLVLKREPIDALPIESRLVDGRVGYVRIRLFEKGSDAKLAEALAAMRTKAGPPFRGVVLDLRDNPGGAIEEGILVADRFLPAGRIVTAEGRNGLHKQDWTAVAAGTEPNYPLVVLVNGGTASASEIVAAALQDQGRAVILGAPSFGKASIQDYVPFDDGSVLKITKARYLTPLGQPIHGRGVIPDVLAADGKAPKLPAGAKPWVEVEKLLTTTADPAADRPLRAATAAISGWPAFKAKLDAARR